MIYIEMADSHLLFISLKLQIMKTITLFIIVLLLGSVVCAQEVISSSGATQTTSEIEISWTLGELVIETNSAGSNTLTQGFHQSKLTVTSVPEVHILEIELEVFPNPSHDFLIIQFEELVDGAAYSLFDITGKLIERELITSTRTVIQLEKYSSGQYILKLTKNFKEPLKTFQILKE